MIILAYAAMIILFLASVIISWRFKSVAKKYSEFGLSSGLSGAEMAKRILQDNGLHDIQIISIEGQLSDHYNPADKTVNLSPEVYHGRSVLAAAVATHECGHAIQHAKAYSWLEFRSTLAGPLTISSRYMQWILLAGIILINTSIGKPLLGAGIVLYALTTLFSFITLPVEFDASRRAMAWLSTSGLAKPDELDNAKKALNWAASTYVVAAMASLATLVYYVLIYMGRRD